VPEFAVMEAHFHLSPLIEPIGRKPFLKKWIDQKPTYYKPVNKRFSYQFEDIYRFLFHMLEQENLELAYRFRYTVEATGQAPFIKRQDQLDKALKRAHNKAYEPLERLLDEIQLELGLDYESHAPVMTVLGSLTLENLLKDREFEETVIPTIKEIPSPTVTKPEYSFFPDIRANSSFELDTAIDLPNNSVFEYPVVPSGPKNFKHKTPESKDKIGVPDTSIEKLPPGQVPENMLLKPSPFIVNEYPFQSPLTVPLEVNATQASGPNRSALKAGMASNRIHHSANNPGMETAVPAATETSDEKQQTNEFYFNRTWQVPHRRMGKQIEIKASGFSSQAADKTNSECCYPNLPDTDDQQHTLPDGYRLPQSEQARQENSADADTAFINHPVVRHSLAGFKLPLHSSKLQATRQLGPIKEDQSIRDPETKPQQTTTDSVGDEKWSALTIGRNRNLINRIENDANDLQSKQTSKLEKNCKIKALLMPPPLYKFKFEVKRPMRKNWVRTNDAGTSLVISKECIQRRSETIERQNHFLTGSAAWHYFQTKELQPFYRDTTSLIIQRDCIKSRIDNVKLPTKHALELSPLELETFNEFDGIVDDANSDSEKHVRVESTIQDPASTDLPSDTDSSADADHAGEIHTQLRNELYQKSLDRLNKRDGTLRKWSLLDSPKISVRTSSEYLIKHVLPVIDKISIWRKSVSTEIEDETNQD
jgi:hypothetical protein